jgi:RNA polymerase sigma-70 factor, ECF subfamily
LSRTSRACVRSHARLPTIVIAPTIWFRKPSSRRSATSIGTNIRAWLFTILRNSFFSELRKQRREVADVDGKYAAQLTIGPTQVDRVEFRDFRRALLKLPTEQREALILVGPAGFSYEEAAAISGCAVGTIKSRVNRGRNRLIDMVDGETVDIKRKSVA